MQFCGGSSRLAFVKARIGSVYNLVRLYNRRDERYNRIERFSDEKWIYSIGWRKSPMGCGCQNDYDDVVVFYFFFCTADVAFCTRGDG